MDLNDGEERQEAGGEGDGTAVMGEQTAKPVPVVVRMSNEEKSLFLTIDCLVRQHRCSGYKFCDVSDKVSKPLREYFNADATRNPLEVLLRLSVCSEDFQNIKCTGVCWNILVAAEEVIRTWPSNGELSVTEELKDEVFEAFFYGPRRNIHLQIRKQAVKVWALQGMGERYRTRIQQMAEEGRFKEAVDVATAFGIWNLENSNEVFMLPLILMSDLSTMYNYLEKTDKVNQFNMVTLLDEISEDRQKIEDIVTNQPKLAEGNYGVSNLVGKSLDKLMKKMISKFKVPSSAYPLSEHRWACADIYYWVKQMFGIDGDHDLKLINWREIMMKKCGDKVELQRTLIDCLLGCDVKEAKYWSKYYNMKNVRLEAISSGESESEEEDWEEAVDSAKKSTFIQLPLTENQVIMVDSKPKFNNFIKRFKDISDDGEIVGMDAEFIASNSKPKISLLQLSLSEEIYLLDWDNLPNELTSSDYNEFIETVFLKKEILIVGYGVMEDIKLLQNSFPELRDLVCISKRTNNVLDLERMTCQVVSLFSLASSRHRGLSGLCEMVLGSPLCKADQISDWTRRPLRPQQIQYAALDAWVCRHMYSLLATRARDAGMAYQFHTITQAARDKYSAKVDLNKMERGKPMETATLPVSSPATGSPRAPKDVFLVCDTMLQGLGRTLQQFGFDCLVLGNGQDHSDCLELARNPVQRFVLSKGVAALSIAKHLPPGHTMDVKSKTTDLQVEEVFKYFNVQAENAGSGLARCDECNGGEFCIMGIETIKLMKDRCELRKNLARNIVKNVDEDEENLELDDDLPCNQDEEFAVEQSQRWAEVEVVSCLTGLSRPSRLNIYTGETEEGVTVQLEQLSQADCGQGKQFAVCTTCWKMSVDKNNNN